MGVRYDLMEWAVNSHDLRAELQGGGGSTFAGQTEHWRQLEVVQTVRAHTSKFSATPPALSSRFLSTSVHGGLALSNAIRQADWSQLERMLGLKHAQLHAREADSSGNLPAHYAAASNVPPDGLLSALIAAAPDAFARTNKQGLTPLHYALGCASTELVSERAALEILRACPAAACVKTAHFAELPLHIAVAKQAPPAVISALLAAHRTGTEEANAWGSLPVHVGLVNSLPLPQVGQSGQVPAPGGHDHHCIIVSLYHCALPLSFLAVASQ